MNINGHSENGTVERNGGLNSLETSSSTTSNAPLIKLRKNHWVQYRSAPLFFRTSPCLGARARFAQRARETAQAAGAFWSTIEWMPRELVSAAVLNSADAWRRARRTTQRTNLLLPCNRRRNGAVIISVRHRPTCKSRPDRRACCYLERGRWSVLLFGPLCSLSRVSDGKQRTPMRHPKHFASDNSWNDERMYVDDKRSRIKHELLLINYAGSVRCVKIARERYTSVSWISLVFSAIFVLISLIAIRLSLSDFHDTY